MSRKKLTCPEEIDFFSDEYFAERLKAEKPITFAGLAKALGFARSDSLVAYREAEGYEIYHDSMNAACLTVEQFYEEMLFSKACNVAGPIFGLKARIGLTDKSAGDSSVVNITIKGNSARL